MRIIILQSARAGFRWMKQYFREHPQLNSERVFSTYSAAKERLRDNAFAGHVLDDFEDVRELLIARSPFSILFTHRSGTCFIIDIRDQRGMRSHEALRAHIQELKGKYGL